LVKIKHSVEVEWASGATAALGVPDKKAGKCYNTKESNIL
jgi:hypothetical protein